MTRTRKGERCKPARRTALARSMSVTREATPSGGKALKGSSHQRAQEARLNTHASEARAVLNHGRNRHAASRRTKAGEAPPTAAGFFSWLPGLPAPGRPERRAPSGLAAAQLTKTGPLEPARRAAIMVALHRDIAPLGSCSLPKPPFDFSPKLVVHSLKVKSFRIRVKSCGNWSRVAPWEGDCRNENAARHETEENPIVSVARRTSLVGGARAL